VQKTGRQVHSHRDRLGRHRPAGRQLQGHLRSAVHRALEEELDEIEEGKETWTDALKDFYKKFEKELHYAEKHMENVKRMEKPTDEKCERCGSPLVIKWGKHGSFYACSAYDKTDPNSCTFTKENPIDLPDLDSADIQETTQEEYCENCGRPMVLKRGRFGQFMACTGYPDCKTTRRLDQGKKVPTFRWMRSVRSADGISCCATAASASSSPAAAIPSASGSSRTTLA
jgi:ssDNA-binding Zn-finger/Zn-ribbon topoisomerase 1